MSDYDFDGILARLKAPLSGSLSTLEGTFAGDILQAAASELARIWSQELDSVADRAFAATAEGPWLDAVCADYGLARKAGEADGALRARVLARIRGQAASGNAADYREWALEVDGVKAARAFGLLRGANTVDVFIVPAAGADTAALTAAVAARIEERRPVCADVSVAAAQSRSIAVSATVTLTDGAALTAVQTQFSALLAQWLDDAMLTAAGAVIGPGRISALLLACDGVADVTSLALDGGSAAVTLTAGQYAVAGAVELTGAVSA